MLLFQLIVGGVKLKQTLFFVIRNGNKILVELFNNNQYILPNISDHDSLSSIENMIKKKYNLEITTLKEQFSCNSSLCFEAFAPHKIEQNNAVQYTWISIKSAINYTFANIDNTLRKDGLPKEMDFNQVDQAFISSVANKRNNIPRKSLAFQTPLEVFLSYLDESTLSSLN